MVAKGTRSGKTITVSWTSGARVNAVSRISPSQATLATNTLSPVKDAPVGSGDYKYYVADPVDEQVDVPPQRKAASTILLQRFVVRTQPRPKLADAIAAIQAFSPQDIQLLYDLVIPEGESVGHYIRTGTIGGWKRVDQLELPHNVQLPDTAALITQSFQVPEQLQTIVEVSSNQGNSLLAYSFRPESGDHQSIPVITDGEPLQQINGTPAFAQTPQDLFHLLVPVFDQVDQTASIVHITHTNESIDGPWQRRAVLSVPHGTLVKSLTLVQDDDQGSLKAVARVGSPGSPDFLVSYQSDPSFNWQGPFEASISGIIVRVTTDVALHQSANTINNVTGSPGLFHSVYDDREQLELLVPSPDGTIIHYTQPAKDGTSIEQSWTPIATLRPLNGNTQTQTVSISVIQDATGNLEAIAHINAPGALNHLVFYTFNPLTGDWSLPVPVTNPDGKPIIVGHDNGPSDENGDNSGDHHDNGDHNHPLHS